MADATTVDFAATEEQRLLRDTARAFLAERMTPEAVRAEMEGPGGFDRDLWRACADLGWQSLAIPEEHGGAGYGYAELSVVLEELGRVVYPGPFVPSAVMVTDVLVTAGSTDQKERHLPGLASGDLVATVALFDRPRAVSADDVAAGARPDGEGWVIHGTRTNVPFGDSADLFLVAAATSDGPGLFLIPADADGLEVTPTTTLDATRRQATLGLDGIRVGADAVVGAPGAAAGVIDRMLRVASMALALDQVGVAQWCLDTSVDYAKTRYQFGRAIGSFQAVKHKCADMLVAVEHARSAAYYAARVADDPTEFEIAAPLAKSVCSEAATSASAETIQILGGIGFTWEHDAHLYFKRAKTTALMFGDVRHQRRLLGAALGL